MSSAQREAFREVRNSMRGTDSRPGRAGRGAPMRRTFLRADSAGEAFYPMASLMSSREGSGGGRGGYTRLALYLSLLWVAGGGDHSSQRPASFWARLLGMAEPDQAGSRRVRSTWEELAHRRFVRITRGKRSGDIPIVTLLREDGSGAPYSIPTGQDGDLYDRLPEALWARLIGSGELNGAGLAMYVVAVRVASRAGRLESLVFPRATFKDNYGMGESTRKKGLINLAELNVLDAHERSADNQGRVGHRTYKRKVYDLLPIYAPEAAWRREVAEAVPRRG